MPNSTKLDASVADLRNIREALKQVNIIRDGLLVIERSTEARVSANLLDWIRRNGDLLAFEQLDHPKCCLSPTDHCAYLDSDGNHALCIFCGKPANRE